MRRALARQALDAALAYDAARAGRFEAGWRTSGSSANAETAAALAPIRNRIRDLYRNNPYARRIADDAVASVIGYGATPRVKDAGCKAALRRWMRVCDADGQLDFYGLQTLIVRTLFVSGEAVIRLRERRPGDMEVPLQLQVLEGDYIDHTKEAVYPDGRYIIQGVEHDVLGRRTGYWMFRRSPGDALSVSDAVRDMDSHFVPASQVLHVYIKERPGQVRGVSMLAPVVTTLRHIDDYEEAEIVRKKVEACLAAVFTQPEGADDRQITRGVTGSDGQRIETFEPGMILYGRPGDRVDLIEPKAAGGYAEYIRSALGRVAAGSGMMRWQLSGDLSEINYSAFRAGQSSQRGLFDALRWTVLVPMALEPMILRFIDTAYAAGAIQTRDQEVDWGFPPYASVDPLKDAQTAVEEMRLGRKTWPQIVAEQGYDPDEQLAEIAAAAKKFDDSGVGISGDARKEFKNGGEKNQTAPALD